MVGTIASVVDGARAKQVGTIFLVATGLSAAVVGGAVGAAGQAFAVSGAYASAVIALVAGFALLIDVGVLKLRPPYLRRQVAASSWTHRGDAWASAVWGLELGVGFLTHVATAGWHVLLILCWLAGPLAGAALMGTYGVVRGAQPLLVRGNALARADLVSRVPAFGPLRTATVGALLVVLAAAVLQLVHFGRLVA